MKHPRSLVRASGPRRGGSRTPRVTGSGGGRIRDRFGLLLVLLIGAFIAQGLGTGLWARVLISVLQFAALLVAFYSTGVLIGRPSYLVLGLAGLVAFGASAVQAGTGALFALSSITGLVVVSAMLISVGLRVMRHNRVTSQTLLGAVCAYLLLGFFFADLYGAFDALSAQPLFGEQVPRAVYSYFSFVTLTTVGFGDYTAKPELARRFVDLEAVFGQVYIATTLARLVALYRGPSGDRSERTGSPGPHAPPSAARRPAADGGPQTVVDVDHRDSPG